MAELVEADFAAFDGSTELAEGKLRQRFSVEEIVALFARIRFFNSIVHGSGASTQICLMSAQDIRWIQRFNNFAKAFLQLQEAVELAQQRPLSKLEEQGLSHSGIRIHP